MRAETLLEKVPSWSPIRKIIPRLGAIDLCHFRISEDPCSLLVACVQLLTWKLLDVGLLLNPPAPCCTWGLPARLTSALAPASHLLLGGCRVHEPRASAVPWVQARRTPHTPCPQHPTGFGGSEEPWVPAAEVKSHLACDSGSLAACGGAVWGVMGVRLQKTFELGPWSLG